MTVPKEGEACSKVGQNRSGPLVGFEGLRISRQTDKTVQVPDQATKFEASLPRRVYGLGDIIASRQRWNGGSLEPAARLLYGLLP